jgi:hypothetical protein
MSRRKRKQKSDPKYIGRLLSSKSRREKRIGGVVKKKSGRKSGII